MSSGVDDSSGVDGFSGVDGSAGVTGSVCCAGASAFEFSEAGLVIELPPPAADEETR